MILLCLVLTLLVESAVLLFWKERRIAVFGFLAAVNILTNLSINLALALLRPTGVAYSLWVLALELLVLITEAVLLSLYLADGHRGLLYSLSCNLTSYIAGVIILSCL